jgi:hypothetical protein
MNTSMAIEVQHVSRMLADKARKRHVHYTICPRCRSKFFSQEKQEECYRCESDDRFQAEVERIVTNG